MPKYILSPQAQSSLKNIRLYSLKHFGQQQTTKYLKELRNKMKGLAKTPQSGQERNEIKSGYYSAFVGSHTIYYRIANNQIEIIDVLHQSMEPMRHLQ